MSSILQWNIRGLRSNSIHLSTILQEQSIDVICLQETKLPDDTFIYGKFKTYHHVNKNNLIAAGGVSIFVKNNIIQSRIQLNTPIQAVAVRVNLFRPITICNIYFPNPGNDPLFTVNNLINLIKQLPKPYIIMGDFNSKSPLWGSPVTDNCGDIIEEFIYEAGLCVLNDGSITYDRIVNNERQTSAIDLTLCDPELLSSFTWSTLDSLYNSDHYPIKISSIPVSKTSQPKHFNFKKADWDKFSQMCTEKLNLNQSEVTIEQFTKVLMDISEISIPRTSGKPRKIKTWFNSECEEAIKNKKKAYRKACANPCNRNIINYHRLRAISRGVCRRAKKACLVKYISKINYRTKTSEIWKIVKKMKGTFKEPFSHLKDEAGNLVDSAHDIANNIGRTVSTNSSSENYSAKFQKHKENEERKNLNFDSSNEESYNMLFSMRELKSCIAELKPSAPGPDQVSNQLICRLPNPSLELLLKLFNDVWQGGDFPNSWSKATVIPIPKPGKDHTNPSNYRPIALTSCFCKLMEKLVNKRLIWFLEKNDILSCNQAGFRKNRSTVDQLVRLQTFVSSALLKQEHITAIFFDLEKAFDTTWKHGILKDLHSYGLRGNLPKFVKQFLNNRSFKVKVGSELSDPFPQEEGVPQGSVLSPILFEIKINSITKILQNSIDCSLYVDDFLICYKSKADVNIIERQLSLQLNKLEKWADENGFKFSVNKTKALHFCNKYSCVLQHELKLNNSVIENVNNMKFLGMIFDKKLTFGEHIRQLKEKCLKALSAFKILCNPEWGGDSDILLNLYRSLIRSKLDYGSFIYGSAADTHLNKLETIQNRGLRFALGAFRSSRATSLHAEANELPMDLRRQKLGLQYAIKISSTPENPVHDAIFRVPRDVKNNARLKPSMAKPFGLRIANDLQELNLQNKKQIARFFHPQIPPWELRCPEVILDLASSTKADTHASEFRKEFEKIKNTQFKNSVFVYTDGSKDDSRVGMAAVCEVDMDDNVLEGRLYNDASIFTAEAYAIGLALEFLKKFKKKKSFVICSDSLSVLQTLKSSDISNPIILDLRIRMDDLIKKGKNISFIWIPSHMGVGLNDEVDECAKEGRKKDDICTQKTIYHRDLRSKIEKHIKDKWQKQWDADPNNKMYEIMPRLKPRKPLRLIRRDSAVFTRLKIGHSYTTTAFKIRGEQSPVCEVCNVELSTKHLLTNCKKYEDVRTKYYRCTELKDIFDVVEPHRVLNYIKEIKLFDKM